MKNLILINPNSGKLRSKEAAQKLSSRLIELEEELTIKVSESKEDFISYIKFNISEYERVFFLGGDGTVSLGISALMELDQKPIVGILPCGTVNNYSKLLKLPQNLDDAIEEILGFRTAKVDIGKVNNDFFISTFVSGVLAEKIMDVEKGDKQNLGKLAFLQDLPHILKVEEYESYEISLDNEKLEEDLSLILIATGNSVYGMENIFETSKLDDGLLNFIGLRKTGFLEKIGQGLELISKDPNYSESIIQKTFKKASINKNKNNFNKIILDGDESETFPCEIEIIEKAYKVIVGSKF